MAERLETMSIVALAVLTILLLIPLSLMTGKAILVTHQCFLLAGDLLTSTKTGLTVAFPYFQKRDCKNEGKRLD